MIHRLVKSNEEATKMFPKNKTPSSIDAILTDKPRSLMHIKSVVNGDHHSLVMAMFRAQIARLKQINIIGILSTLI